MRAERVTEADEALVEAIERLVPQLSERAAPPGRAELDAIVADERTALLVARDSEDRIVGTLTLATYRSPTGFTGWIEDVVVDYAARGQGAGEVLTREAMRLGIEWKLDSIGLTSRPAREAANRLYRRLGFDERETNVYVWRPL
jgi:ribosomal protein S18 acetylase RimI-like enzyme